MSLLDDNRNSVTVYPEKVQTDVVGNPGGRVPDLESGVVIGGRVQPNGSTELSANGQQLITRKFFRCRTFPAGAFGKAKIDGDPRMWDIDAEPAFHDGSDTTRHYTVSLLTSEPNPLYQPPADPDEGP